MTACLTGLEIRVQIGKIRIVAQSKFDDAGATSISVAAPGQGKSEHRITDDGTSALTIDGRLDLGRAGESWVILNLTAVLVAEGRTITPAAREAIDREGEDGLLLVDDQEMVVQITTPPATIWRPTDSSVTHEFLTHAAVEWIRQAIAAKSRLTPLAERSRTILGLDGTHLGSLVWPALNPMLGEVRLDEGQEWAGVYFIGPTVDSSYAIKPAPRKT
jgi:hypothetical protein